ncbi:MAG: sel1 repeat family protein [Magnetococcales bacterium]|nr:sel1 repeat family protein [Magnetococcales bacterium]NGZ29084.1 sel1 repeat family protein [Magnetococcales bacterium]
MDAKYFLELSSGLQYEFAENQKNIASDSITLNDRGVHLLLEKKGDGSRSGRDLLKQAAQGGDLHAIYNLGLSYALGLGGGRSLGEAIGWFEKGATAGHAGCQYRLGLFYLEGKGITWDMSEAAHWFMEAAEQGYSLAQFMVGQLYQEGRGLPQEPEEAARWYEKAARQGHRQAAYQLAFMHEMGEGVKRNPRTAVTWYTQAAKDGLREAQFQLAVAYERGLGVKRDLALALQWYRKAAVQGHVASQNNVAVLLASQSKEYKEAMYWFQRAAEEGHSKAQQNLGMFYLSGLAGVRNNVLAYFWFSVAASNGEMASMEGRATAAGRMSFGQYTAAESLFRDWRLAYDLKELPKVMTVVGSTAASEAAAGGIIGLADAPPVMHWPPGTWPQEILNPELQLQPAGGGTGGDKSNAPLPRFNE